MLPHPADQRQQLMRPLHHHLENMGQGMLPLPPNTQFQEPYHTGFGFGPLLPPLNLGWAAGGPANGLDSSPPAPAPAAASAIDPAIFGIPHALAFHIPIVNHTTLETFDEHYRRGHRIPAHLPPNEEFADPGTDFVVAPPATNGADPGTRDAQVPPRPPPWFGLDAPAHFDGVSGAQPASIPALPRTSCESPGDRSQSAEVLSQDVKSSPHHRRLLLPSGFVPLSPPTPPAPTPPPAPPAVPSAPTTRTTTPQASRGRGFSGCPDDPSCPPACGDAYALIAHIESGWLAPWLSNGAAIQSLQGLANALRRVLLHRCYMAPGSLARHAGVDQDILQASAVGLLARLRDAVEALRCELETTTTEDDPPALAVAAMAPADAVRVLEIGASVAHYLPVWEGELVGVVRQVARRMLDGDEMARLGDEIQGVRRASGAEVRAALGLFLPGGQVGVNWTLM